jgi:hypothetical protein
LKAYEATLPEQLAKWEREKLGDKTVWTTLDPHELSSTFGAKLTKEKDRSVFVTGKHGVGSYNVVARTDLVGITAVRIEALADKRLPKNGPGRAPDGNFVVSEFEVKVAPESNPAKMTKLVLRNARADFSQQGFDVKTAIDGKVADVDNGWGISPQAGVNHTATFEFKEPIGDGSGTLLALELKQTVVSTQHTLGRFRISVTTSPCPVDLEGVPPNVANLLLIAPYNRNAKQIEHLLGYFRTVDEGLNQRQTALAESKKPRPIDPKLKQLRDAYEVASQPLPVDLKREQLQHDVELSAKLLENGRLTAAQDLAWALINSPAFLFNR